MPSLALACRLSAVSRASRRPFSPASLFSSGEQGAWYDPSDLSTMYQDAAGTIPVTAVEQPVGRMLDKSGRGNHATQTTTASRPRLSARVNLLTATETLATQTVTTRATTQTLRFEGAGTVTLSGTATGTYSAGSHSVTTTAGNLTLTVSGTVTKADLRATNMGVGLPAYQRVNTATDYDTVGFPYYLLFDGVDDYLSTGSIDFTTTDKMTVFAGVRKLSDAASGAVAELSSNVGGNNQSFALFAPGSNGANHLRWVPEGGKDINSPNQYPAPISTVLTGVGKKAGIGEFRVNGVSVGAGFVQTAGNYGNYPLYIGRRGGTSYPFNGHLYGLIVRGAQTDDAHLTHAEKYLAYKSGVTL